MRVAFLDCAGGISGGAALAALLDAGADVRDLRDRLQALGWDGSSVRVEDVMVGPFRARTVVVENGDASVGSRLADMEGLVTAASLPDPARDLALGVYRRLAEAEARVHGSRPNAVTFHEVGSRRSFVGVVGTALALDGLGIDRVVASPLPLGRGQAETAHGRLRLPAPATLELLRGVPVEPQGSDGELVTPTGAAILAAAAAGFGAAPSMTIGSVGYGTAGSRPTGILVRVIVGEGARETTIPGLPRDARPGTVRA